MATSKIRFYLDENVHHHVADGLRHRGIEVLTTPEAGHMSWDDDKHLAYALSERYVILTQDSDFLRLHSQSVPHAGIVYYKPDDRTIKQIIAGAVLIFDVLTPEDMINHVEYL